MGQGIVHTEKRRIQTLGLMGTLLSAALVLLVPDASAITVVTHFIGGTPPSNAVGGGSLHEIFDAAARMWEAAYGDDFTIHLYYGWASLGDAGTHSLLEQGGIPNREISGLVLFDNSGAVAFYLDPTPGTDEEYGSSTEKYRDLGGGPINVARVLGNPLGDARDHCDLLSVAIHEIGHALGMCNANATFVDQSRSGSLAVQAGLPFSGTVIPLASNYSGVTSHFDAADLPYGSVMQGLCDNERRLPSTLDVIANAQISGFRSLGHDLTELSETRTTVPPRPGPGGRRKGLFDDRR